MKRHLLISEFLVTPWALMPERIESAAAVLSRWAKGEPAAWDDDDPDEGRGGPRKSAWEIRRERAQALAGSNAIAVLPLYGVISQRANLMTEWCGGTSTQQWASAFREALANPQVGQILIDIDSPGGSVYGVQELAEEIYNARSTKPIIAISNSLAASAAYWLGAAASEFYVTPGGEVGSIGVWMAHENWAKALEQNGVEVTLISAGKWKTEGNPYGPLPDESKDFMQSRVNDYFGAFTKGVSKGRGVPITQVRDGMGQGRVLGAKQALEENMVDGITTFEGLLSKMQKSISKSSQSNASRQARHRELDLLAAG